MEGKRRISKINILLISMLVICVIASIGLILVSKSEKQIKLTGKSGDNIENNYATTEQNVNTWDVSQNEDGSVIAILTDDGTLTISGTGEMRDYAFLNTRPWDSVKSQIKSVIVKSGVTSIGACAFDGCKSLTSIEIPDSVTVIRNDAFSECESLTSIEIPEGVTNIGNRAFLYCESLTSIEIPDGVTSIGMYVFSGCKSLTRIKIPEGVTNIGDYALSNCYSLTSIEIPDSVTSIGRRALGYCSRLTSIEIPDGVTSINESAFQGCSSLTRIKIPEGVMNIGDSAFNSCVSLTSIEIPDSVTIIGAYAFYYCESLISIEIPDQVTSIGKNAFNFCKSLTSMEIPEGVTCIEESAFSYCTSLTSIEIPDSVTSIGRDAFGGCESLTSIEIPEGVTRIEDETFGFCTSLTSIEIPDKVTSIGEYAFQYCESLTSIEIPDKVTSIGEYAFYYCTSLTSIEIPDEVTSIGKNAFRYCESLTSMEIPEGVTCIEESTFSCCKSLTSIEIPEGVTSIGEYAFHYCYSLTSILIPSNVTRIGDAAFEIAYNLIIICKSGTTAETYAKENDINYQIDDAGPTIEGKGCPTAPVKSVQIEINVKDDLSGVNEENLKYIWSIKSNNVTKEEIVNTFKNGDTLELKDVTGTYYLWIYAVDKLGNETISKVGKVDIDNTKPTAQTTYSIQSATNQNVTVTIKTNEKVQEIDDWTISTNKQELRKEYSSNTSANGENITIKDLVGNEIVVNVKVLNIDKVKPELTLNAQASIDKITVNVSAVDEESGIKETSYKYYIKEGNGTYSQGISGGTSNTFENLKNNTKYTIKVEVSDKAGNTVSKETEVTTTSKSNKITSTKQKVDEENKIIRAIKPKTTVQEIKKNLQSEMNYEIVDLEGKSVTDTTIIGTGFKVKMADGKEYTLIVWGDYTGDGKISIAELARASRVAVEEEEPELKEKMIIDVSMDGKIKVTDLAAISRLAIE